MKSPRLFMVLLGCRPKGRLTEQHDVFFGIAESLKELIPAMKEFWPEAKGAIHIDAWREVSQVGDFAIRVEKGRKSDTPSHALFFINLGGYKPGEFEEFHYKLLQVAEDKSEAIRLSKQSTFYKHVGFKGATSHIDDKYGVDVDDLFEIKDILADTYKNEFQLVIHKQEGIEDEMHLGYLKLEKIKD